jgi:ABC-type proline/glycine betaine transport system permease subunit
LIALGLAFLFHQKFLFIPILMIFVLFLDLNFAFLNYLLLTTLKCFASKLLGLPLGIFAGVAEAIDQHHTFFYT